MTIFEGMVYCFLKLIVLPERLTLWECVAFDFNMEFLNYCCCVYVNTHFLNSTHWHIQHCWTDSLKIPTWHILNSVQVNLPKDCALRVFLVSQIVGQYIFECKISWTSCRKLTCSFESTNLSALSESLWPSLLHLNPKCGIFTIFFTAYISIYICAYI